MKIALAQTRNQKGEILENIQNHNHYIQLAADLGADAVFFSELSLTSYEPKLAADLAMIRLDKRLDILQELSNTYKIAIGVGAPTIANDSVQISMLIYKPNKKLQVYAKQILHADEIPIFKAGNKQERIDYGDIKIVPAICFESLQPKHIQHAINLRGDIYLASVAKSKNGIDKAYPYYATKAKEYNIPILMVNSIGYCDDFESYGFSAIWNQRGELIAKLDNRRKGLLIYETKTGRVSRHYC